MDHPGLAPINLRHLHHERSRHGKICFYVRLPGCRRVRVTNPDDPDAIAEAFRIARGAVTLPERRPGKRKKVRGSLAALVALYCASPEFRRLGTKTQATRRGILDACILEPWEGEPEWTYGDCPVKALRARDCRTIRDRKVGLPEAANGRLKALRALLEWGVSRDDGLEHNVAKDVPYIETGTQGHHAWTVAEVRQFEKAHPVGTMARLALALLLYTGQRRSDVVLLGRQHVDGGWLSFTQAKNRARKPVTIDVPILPELAAVIAATPSRGLAFLETAFSRPFTGNGFGNRFRKWCDDAGLPHCSAHGLRKAGATIAAENGATEHQLMAVFGWSTSKEASRYTRSARRKRLAGDAMHMLVPARTENVSPAPAEVVREGAGNRGKKVS